MEQFIVVGLWWTRTCRSLLTTRVEKWILLVITYFACSIRHFTHNFFKRCRFFSLFLSVQSNFLTKFPWCRHDGCWAELFNFWQTTKCCCFLLTKRNKCHLPRGNAYSNNVFSTCFNISVKQAYPPGLVQE